ncbi:MAG: PadR family transcriptional regulator [Gemmatimonadetes bacterium]|nr:PadR family transcriptional regulator [Gemmatimonadota bacterium]
MGSDGFIGEFEQMLLLAILRLEGEAYGVRLMEELEERVGRSVSRGSVYVTLDRMEAKGWIESTSVPAGSDRGGRPRRVVGVTLEGVERLRRSREALFRLWDGLEDALETP